MAKVAYGKKRSRYSERAAVRKALKKIKALPRPELKYHDMYVSRAVPDGTEGSNLSEGNIVPVNSTAAISGGATAGTSLVSMNLGNTAQTRVGQKIIIKSIQFKGKLQQGAITYGDVGSSISGTPLTRVKIMLVLDRQSNGLQPSPSDILQNLTSVGAPDYPNKIGSAERYQTLWTHTYIINRETGAYTGTADEMQAFGVQRKVEFYKKVNIPVTFATGGSSSDDSAYVKSNNVFMVFMRDYTAAAQGAVSLLGSARIRYEDC